jgi:hypothetical protein
MANIETNQKNDSCNAPVDITEFVKSHQATLDYLSRFGSPIERAKANTLLKLSFGGLL